MNKDMIFDADGQAAQTELKDQRKGAVRYMIKTYVIDTNVLIQAPYAIKRSLLLPMLRGLRVSILQLLLPSRAAQLTDFKLTPAKSVKKLET